MLDEEWKEIFDVNCHEQGGKLSDLPAQHFANCTSTSALPCPVVDHYDKEMLRLPVNLNVDDLNHVKAERISSENREGTTFVMYSKTMAFNRSLLSETKWSVFLIAIVSLLFSCFFAAFFILNCRNHLKNKKLERRNHQSVYTNPLIFAEETKKFEFKFSVGKAKIKTKNSSSVRIASEPDLEKLMSSSGGEMENNQENTHKCPIVQNQKKSLSITTSFQNETNLHRKSKYNRTLLAEK